VREVQVIRGGNSLLYGPEPAPVINFVSKGAVAGAPFGASTEQMIGSNGTWQTYNVVKGSDGDVAYRVAGWINRSDGRAPTAATTSRASMPVCCGRRARPRNGAWICIFMTPRRATPAV
jgi:hypothetical protein